MEHTNDTCVMSPSFGHRWTRHAVLHHRCCTDWPKRLAAGCRSVSVHDSAVSTPTTATRRFAHRLVLLVLPNPCAVSFACVCVGQQQQQHGRTAEKAPRSGCSAVAVAR